MEERLLRTIIAKRIEIRKEAKAELVKLLKDKLNIKWPTKAQAIKYIKENVKSVQDIEDAYSIIPKLLPILKKGSVTADLQIFPKTFIKNLILLVAIISVFQGTFPAKSEAVKEIKEITIKGFEPLGYVSSESLKKFIKPGDNMVMVKIKFLRAIEEGELKVHGGKMPKDLKAFELILSEEDFGEFLYSVPKLKSAQGFVYLHKDLPGRNEVITETR